YGITNYLKNHRFARAAVAFVGVACVLIYVTGFVASFSSIKFPIQGNFALFFVGLALIWFVVLSGSEFQLHFGADEESSERDETERMLEASADPEDALKLDLKRLNQYYAINQSQARASFFWAVVAMLVGFATIIT